MLKHVDQAIEVADVECQANILGFLCEIIAPNLNGGFSAQELRGFSEKLSQISGGSGFDLIGLFLWPEEELPEYYQRKIKDTQKRLALYKPGQQCPFHLNPEDV